MARGKAELRAIGSLLRESGLDAVSAGELFTYAARAIQGREYAKFIFTRSLSAALECIARWGAAFGLGREDLSFLRLPEILDNDYACPHADMTSALMDRIDRARMEQTLARSLQVSMTERPQLTVMRAGVSRQAVISWDSGRKAFSEGPTPPSASQCSTIIPRPREAKSSASSLKEA